jgi:chromosomal replication initiator protein
MLDIISTYTPETITLLRTLREQLLIELSKSHDTKKVLSFLSKCCVVSIQEDEKTVRIGVPNEFVMQQLKKFFHTDLQRALQEVHAPGYKIAYSTIPELTDDHPLHANVKRLLQIEEKPKTKLDTTTKDELSEYFGILFEKKYTFDNFVVGGNNELAHAAASAVSSEPGTVYNPLFIYGNVWLGKTHLMQAIGNTIITQHPDKTVFYLPTSKFIDKVIFAIRHGHLARFMEQLEQIDVLMLDDIQFLAGKDKTQEIFHNIFNEFYAKNKQIVITSDQAPKALTLLEARLQSRFTLGLIVDIAQPDLETRKAILEMKLKQKGQSLSDEIINFLAEHITNNIRELEWAINILLTKQQLLGQTLTITHAHHALETIGITTTKKQATTQETVSTPEEEATSALFSGSQHEHVESLLQDVAAHFGIETKAILWQGRTKEVSQARQVAMYLIKTKYGWSLQRIGDYFGGRNHASVIYAIQICEQELQRQPQLRKFVQGL